VVVSKLVGEAFPRDIYDLALDDGFLAEHNTLGGIIMEGSRPRATAGVVAGAEFRICSLINVNASDQVTKVKQPS